jgi:hypothetical protein
MKHTKRSIARTVAVVVAVVLAGNGPARAEVAATGTFGINVDIDIFPTPMGTFTGEITSFNAGPFSVGGTNVDLGVGVGGMDITNGQIPSINVGALAATFSFSLADQNSTLNNLDITAAGRAVCTDAITCAQGAGTFVAEVTARQIPTACAPNAAVRVRRHSARGVGSFDATGVFGLNAFTPLDVTAGANVLVGTDDEFFDNRKNTLRNFLVDLIRGRHEPRHADDPRQVRGAGAADEHRGGPRPSRHRRHRDRRPRVHTAGDNGVAYGRRRDSIVDGVDPHEQLKPFRSRSRELQDVTTTTDGGKVCGQVDQLSPFMVAKAQPRWSPRRRRRSPDADDHDDAPEKLAGRSSC